ncbi:MAG: Rieske (2Fe-2S) protein [Verrucomicrobiota bacterium]
MSQSPNNPKDDGIITRRTFMQVGGAVVGACYAAALGYPVYQYLATAAQKAEAESAVKEVELKDADKLPKRTALMFKFAGHPALLIHHDDDSWSALSAVCTHLGCTVQYDSEKARIACACHGGIYDPKTGGNVSGPPPKPLAQLHVEISQGKAVVSRA